MRINGKIYHLKKDIKILLLIILLVILIIISSVLIINKIKDDFKECDEALGYKCSVYDLHNYNSKNN
jgi:hypothetical protein